MRQRSLHGPVDTWISSELLTLKLNNELLHWTLRAFSNFKNELKSCLWHYLCTTETVVVKLLHGRHLRSSVLLPSWVLWSFPKETYGLIALSLSASVRVTLSQCVESNVSWKEMLRTSECGKIRLRSFCSKLGCLKVIILHLRTLPSSSEKKKSHKIVFKWEMIKKKWLM